MSEQIDVQAAKVLLDKGAARFIDASWALDGTDMRSSYLKANIPTAVFFDIDAISDPSTGLPHMAPTPSQFADAVGQMGISEDHTVIIYDQQGLFSAARVWWTFRLMGHQSLYVLRGGLPAWIASGYEITETIEPVIPRHYTTNPEVHLAIELKKMMPAANSQRLILDARPAARFHGHAPEPRAGLRSGHIPGSLSLPASELIVDGALRPKAELKARFESMGVTPDSEIVTTCGSGVTAAIIFLALKEAGYENVQLYDGSWAEWGRPESGTPVLTD